MKRLVLAALAALPVLVACSRDPAPSAETPLAIPPLPPTHALPPRPAPPVATDDFGLPDGCHGTYLAVTDSLEACGCKQLLAHDGGGVRADLWCGPPRGIERHDAVVTVNLKPSVVQPGDALRVVVVVRNPSPTEAVIYRVRGQRFYADIVKRDGSPIPHGIGTSGSARDEALFALEAGGTLSLTLPLRADHLEWDAANHAVRRPLPRGSYLVRAIVGLEGKEFATAPLEVR